MTAGENSKSGVITTTLHNRVDLERGLDWDYIQLRSFTDTAGGCTGIRLGWIDPVGLGCSIFLDDGVDSPRQDFHIKLCTVVRVVSHRNSRFL